ncbi:MAG: tetrahydrofolate dehydrogenase/cyclohydrolase catalytic domain-containing protein [Bacteroidota bacterium]
MAVIIDGKVVSAAVKAELKEKTQILINEKNIRPGLAVLLVGENPGSVSYVKSKEKACIDLGFHSVVKRVPDTFTEKEVLDCVNEWNNDPKIHGILVQMPLPKHIDENKVILSISPDKDVDGFHPESIGRLVIGLPGFVPCTPAGIMELFKYYKIDLKGKHVVVLGRSNIVGKPIANLLYQKNPTANAIVTICHTATNDIKYYTCQADVLIAAMGVPMMITADYVKEGVVVIDVGINRIEDTTIEKGYRLVGDVDFESVSKLASAITPVPGGVGLMTIAMLMKNTYNSAAGWV